MPQKSLPNNTATETEQPPHIRLNYLDGLRGLAALYVVLYHCFEEVTETVNGNRLSPALLKWIGWLAFGHIGVDIFIVLSGYCLMLPVVRSLEQNLIGTPLDFLKRRAKRILPPYYAALLVSLLLIRMITILRIPSGTKWDMILPAFTLPVLLSHIMLIHNLSPEWSSKIDYPMWSVATEWQIYFLFYFLLLPAWKYRGSLAAISAGFLFWVLIKALFHTQLDRACYQFSILFTFGMTAADIGFSRQPRLIGLRNHLPWGSIATIISIALCFFLAVHPQWQFSHTSGVDFSAGLAVASLLIFCTGCMTHEKPTCPLIMRLLESKMVFHLGLISYSLYLIHAPVLAICYSVILQWHLTSYVALTAMIGIGLPCSLAMSYIFFLAFEQPFLSKPGLQGAENLTKLPNRVSSQDTEGIQN